MAFQEKIVDVGTADTLLYECPASTSGSVHGLIFSNLSVSQQTVTFSLYSQATGITRAVTGAYPVSPSAPFVWAKPINVEPGDKLLARASVANAITAVLSVYVDLSVVPTPLIGRGVYSSSATYQRNEYVSLNGGSYVALNTVTGVAPPSANWMTLAEALTSASDWNSTSGQSGYIANKPTLGTASALDAANSGDAGAVQVVKGNDSRLSDARTPTAHTHPISAVTNLQLTLNGLQPVSGKDVANGYAGLDASGLISASALPALSITDTFPVASQAAMLALTAERGDVAIRSDLSKSYILKAEPASVLANWSELLSGGGVSSVAGKTGVVTLVKADVGLANVDNTSDLSKPVSTAQQAALDAKANLTAGVSGIAKASGGILTAAAIGDYPTFNQNTSGTAANVTGVVAIMNGGTGSTTAAAARTALEAAPLDHSGLTDSAALTGTETILVNQPTGTPARGTIQKIVDLLLTRVSTWTAKQTFANIDVTSTLNSKPVAPPKYYSDTPPVNPIAGTVWVDTTSGIEYEWFFFNGQGQWVEFGTEALMSQSYTGLTDQPITNTWRFTPYAEVAGAGTTQATATPITKSFNKVLTATASANAFVLPAASAVTIPAGKSLDIYISNGTTQSLSVFPPAGGQINYSGANVAASIGSYGTLRLVLSDASNNIYTQV